MSERREKPLTEPMKAALAAMPFGLDMWGGKPIGLMPGPFTMGTLNALERRGLAKALQLTAFRFVWRRKETRHD